MGQYELLRILVRCFEELGIPYFITGSLASMAYGEPRLTNDIDVVADINDGAISGLKKYFPETDFYLSEGAIRDAIRLRSQFNIIHSSSGLKIDINIHKKNPFDDSRFSRVKRIRPFEDTEANFSSPEDIIIKKMDFYREGGSEKHLRDIAGILKISGNTLDFNHIGRWADTLGLRDIWDTILKRVKHI